MLFNHAKVAFGFNWPDFQKEYHGVKDLIEMSVRKVLMMYLVLADFNLISSGNS